MGTGMTDVRLQLGLLAKVVITLSIVLMIVGVVWRGVTLESIERIWDSLLARPSGPMAFRFILQPSIAAIVAIRDGLYDVRRSVSVSLDNFVES
jgi:hypothetical protein